MDATMTTPAAHNQAALSEQLDPYRRELHVHCYRMLGSFHEAEDLVQETFLRAWRARDSFEGRSSLRSWLYRIATNARLDALQRRSRKIGAEGEVLWLEPYPDELLDEPAAAADDPESAVVDKETIELAFLVAIQHVPPRPRAVLILRDVLGWSAKETAALLGTSVATVTSALQRARATMRRRLPERRLEWAPGGDPGERERLLLDRYVEATERGDASALVEMLTEDARFSMPPEPGVWVGRDAVVGSWVEGGFGSPEFGQIVCSLTRANRQPAVANYVVKPGERVARGLALDVLRIERGAIAEVVTFPEDVFPAFGLPLRRRGPARAR